MTAHYARLSDKTVREHWERARKVNAEGQPVRISPDGPLGDAAWAKQQLSRATQALPNGYCQLPLVKTCPHANSCLTCPMFVTTAEFLPQHHAQRQATLQIISAAEAAGHARVAEMNRQVASNLDKIIATLEDEGTARRSVAALVQTVLGHVLLTTTQIYLTPRKEEVIRRVLAHHAEQTRQAAERARPAPAPGYRPETMDVLFGGRPS